MRMREHTPFNVQKEYGCLSEEITEEITDSIVIIWNERFP